MGIHCMIIKYAIRQPFPDSMVSGVKDFGIMRYFTTVGPCGYKTFDSESGTELMSKLCTRPR